MNIGHLFPTTIGGKDALEGSVETLKLEMKIRLKRVQERRGENSPDYEIYTRSKMTDRDVRVGSAWIKTVMRGPHAGEEFLSLAIDDPSLDKPFHAAAFRNEDGKSWDIVWSRPRGGDVTDTAA